MSRRPSATARAKLWKREALNAYLDGRGRLPICPHCDLAVMVGQAWDRCHVGAPAWSGGKRLQVGHRLCNQLQNQKVDTPAFAKSNRVHNRHIGASGPGLGKAPMRAGRRSGLTKTMRRGLQPRLTHAQKHAAFLAGRAIAPQPEASP